MPLAIGVRGLVGLAGAPTASRRRPGGAAGGGRAALARREEPEQRAVGRSFTAAALVTIAAGGDNLAVYIPLFRVGGATNVGAIVGGLRGR